MLDKKGATEVRPTSFRSIRSAAKFGGEVPSKWVEVSNFGRSSGEVLPNLCTYLNRPGITGPATLEQLRTLCVWCGDTQRLLGSPWPISPAGVGGACCQTFFLNFGRFSAAFYAGISPEFRTNPLKWADPAASAHHPPNLRQTSVKL